MALSLQVCLLAACTNEMTESPVNPGDGYLELNFTTIETRTELNQSGAGNFSQGDKIGLFIGNGATYEYRELTYTSGTWEPRLRRSDFGDGTLTLAAHYPALTDQYGQAEKAPFTLAEDQTANGFAASDLLTAQKSLPAGDNRADMTFTHALHRLRVEITGESVSEVKFRSRMKGEVNLLTGTVTAEEDSFGWISPRKNTDGSYEAVILPQTAAALRDAEGLLKITTAKGERIYKAPANVNGKALDEFLAGQQLTLKLSLKENTEPEPPVISDWANKKMWVYGIKAPVWEEGSPDWKQFYPNFYTTYYLPWKAEYGFFDCNKVDPTNTNTSAYSDGNLCWAASASNLLHWWIAQNKTYIERYGNRYKGPSYEYPLQKQQESDILQCFTDSFINMGGYGEAGVNWFISGKIPSSPSRRQPYNDAGYFKEVFQNVSLGKDYTGMGKVRFNETIKDALANRKAIAVSIAFTTGGHLETIWGAEFDQNGDVAYIYMADNNDRESYEKYQVGIGRFKIVYTSDGIFTRFESGSIDSSIANTIKGLTTIELGQEQWEAFFRQHPEL